MKKHFELEKPPASLPYPFLGALALMLGILALGVHFEWRPSSSMLLGGAFIAIIYGTALAFTSLRRNVIAKRRGCGLQD